MKKLEVLVKSKEEFILDPEELRELEKMPLPGFDTISEFAYRIRLNPFYHLKKLAKIVFGYD